MLQIHRLLHGEPSVHGEKNTEPNPNPIQNTITDPSEIPHICACSRLGIPLSRMFASPTPESFKGENLNQGFQGCKPEIPQFKKYIFKIFKFESPNIFLHCQNPASPCLAGIQFGSHSRKPNTPEGVRWGSPV